MSADGGSTREKLVAGAVEKPVLGAFVAVMLLMAAGFLIAFLLFVV
ncbi:hypothetical protein [Halobaculum gomorrense]|uniref:Uncharacterized protein n=1 Tax=Halobaculum gomorrense TaxID=43928 RepID=A0A1M5JZW2_9EURY|nr:hypothetical protein [Halobaculum gomorrense]SHG46086.1 hypothetical protein SAMN05443636_0328 [Halobaculum gomorrense]